MTPARRDSERSPLSPRQPTTDPGASGFPVPEQYVTWDPSEGHDHDGGVGGSKVDYANLLNRGHSLTGADHTETGLTAGDILTALTATTFGWAAPVVPDHDLITKHPQTGLTAGHLLTALSPTTFGWAAPTIDDHDLITKHPQTGLTAGHILTALTATTFGWQAPVTEDHDLITKHPQTGLTAGHVLTALTATTFGWQAPATPSHTLLGGHSDATGAPAQGDLLYRNASSQWTRLAIGTSAQVLKGGSLPAWGSVAFSELSGSLTAAQHGALSTSATHALAGDASGTTAAVVVDKIKGKSVTTPTVTDSFAKYDGSGIVWASPSLTALAASGLTTGHLLVATGASSYALEAPGTRVIQSGAGAPSSSVPAGTLYWDTTNLKLYRSSGAGVWVAVAAMMLTGLTLASASDGQLLMATGSTTYGLEALTARVSRSGAGSPNGSVTGLAGALYLNTSDNTLWRCTSGTTWVQVAGSGGGSSTHNLLDGSVHPDTVAGTVVQGDLIVGNSTPKWSRLARGTTDQYLKTNSFGSLQWAQPALSEISGTLSAAQHGHISSVNASHNVAGDVTGTTLAVTVAKLNGVTVMGVTSADNHKGLVYDHGGTAKRWWSRDVAIDCWSRAAIQTNLTTSDTRLLRVGGSGTNIPAPFIPHKSGIITGLSVATENGGSVGANNLIVTVYKNGVATTVTLTVTGTDVGSTKGHTVAFAANDKIDVYARRSGALNDRDIQVTPFICWTE